MNQKIGRVCCVIPTFNRQVMLEKALASVVAQTVPVDQVIVVDDGSEDDTAGVVARFVEMHSEIQFLYLRQHNCGPAVARNRGVQATACDLIAFLDDDDIWAPDKIAQQLQLFLEKPQLAMVGCCSEISSFYSRKQTLEVSEWNLLWRNYFVTSGVVIKRSVFLQCGGFPAGMRYCEDYALWLQVVGQKYSCRLLNKILVGYGNGKPGFGHDGLTKNLNGLRQGESQAIDLWCQSRSINGFVKFAVLCLLALRHWRRQILVWVRH